MNKFKKKCKKIFAFLKKEPVRIALGLLFFLPGFILEKCELTVLSRILCLIALVIAGLPVLVEAIKGIFHGELLDETFLMSIASIGAIVLGEYTEAAAVMIFYLVGEYFEHRAVRRSRGAIKSLMDIRPAEATVLRGGREERVDAEEVEVGESILIRSGERVPIDCVILSGNADLDTSALTGESVPRAVRPGDPLDSGAVVLSGVLTCKTLRPADESAAARILELVENANERKSKEENFITKFSRVYTPSVVVGALLVAILPPIFGWTEWSEAIYRALVFLVVSCPCALVISVPLAFFGGIGCAASRGILYKGGNTFSAIAHAKTFAFDKTGTLTTGRFAVSGVYPVGMDEKELLALAASAEYVSLHPIALCIKQAAGEVARPDESREVPGKGSIATVAGRQIAVGNRALMRQIGAQIRGEHTADAGIVYLADGSEYLGCIAVSDEIKPEAKAAIAQLRQLGAEKTVILSGDRKENVERVKKAVGLDAAEAELLPNEKYERLERLIAEGNGKTVYVGDGINDAPSLARADVGVAMGAIGSDSAIEAADIVIMSDRLDKLPEAIRVARKTLRIAKENIVFALAVKIGVLILGALGIANMWLAVFADVGVAVIAVLNAMRAMRIKKAG